MIFAVTAQPWLPSSIKSHPDWRIQAERSRLNEVSQRGKASVRTVKRALSLLKVCSDQGLRDREIADGLLVNPATVARARKRYVEEGPR